MRPSTISHGYDPPPQPDDEPAVLAPTAMFVAPATGGGGFVTVEYPPNRWAAEQPKGSA
jgi:hypothetical protein